MTNEELIVRLTRELYDLKAMIEMIRDSADSISLIRQLQTKDKKAAIEFMNKHAIDIVNMIDTPEIYD